VADDRGGAYAAVEQAIRVGYKKIGHLAGYSHTNIGKERQRGFALAMEHHHMPVKKEWIASGGFGEEDGYNGLMKWYKSGKLPEFVFTVTFPVALGVYRAAEELGLKIPDDIDIISFGISGLNQFLTPPMSYIEQPTVVLGKKAMDLTLESIRQKSEYVPKKIVLPTKLVLCKTCLGS